MKWLLFALVSISSNGFADQKSLNESLKKDSFRKKDSEAKVVKSADKKKIQPNVGQCDPAQASPGSHQNTDDLHCVSPAPLGPDLKDSKPIRNK